MTRIDQIMKLIQEEAEEMTGDKYYVAKLLKVYYKIDARIAMLIKDIGDRERENNKQKGGG